MHIRGRSLQLLVGDVLTPKGGRPATSPPGLKQDRRSLAELKSLDRGAAGGNKSRIDAEAQRVRVVSGGVAAFDQAVDDPIAAAQRRLAIAGQVTGESDARAEVGLRRQCKMAVFGHSRVLQHTGHPGLRIQNEGIEVGAAVPPFDRAGSQVVAQPEIERETASDFEIVLEVAAVRPAVEGEKRAYGLAAAGDFAEQEGSKTETGPRRALRVVGQTAPEGEIPGRVHTVDEIQSDPPLIGSHLEDVPPSGPGQAVGNLDRVLAAMASGETHTCRTDSQHSVDLHRRKSVLGKDRGKSKFGGPTLVEARMYEDQVLPRRVGPKLV